MDVITALSGSRPGPREWFTGVAWIDQVAIAIEPSRLRTSTTHFTPGARTSWHRHPFGEVVQVLHGVGRIQSRGGPVREVHAGDTVVADCGEWHWHGAAPKGFMTHASTQEADLNGVDTEWGEHVTDAEYRLPPTGSVNPQMLIDRVSRRDPCW
jgi:quercetin dioxygenase-like cupin family protein